MAENHKRRINIKKSWFITAALFFLVFVHHFILHFQNSYSLDIGPGDTDYYTVNRKPEFGIPEKGEWIRGMRKRSFLELPFLIRGDVVRLSLEVKGNVRPEKILFSNSKKESIGILGILPNNPLSLYTLEIKTINIPGKKINIKMSNYENPARELDLHLNKVYIETGKGGTDLPWLYDLYFVLALCGFFFVLTLAGLKTNQSCVGAGILGILIILARFVDAISYIAYLKNFLFLGVPFLLISMFILRIICRKSAFFEDETTKIIAAIFIIGFLIHFIGIFYPYHMNKDGRLRISFFRLMEEQGVNQFISEMSRQHSLATGPENEGIPYPPWYNLIAYPFVKMGIQENTWLRFQFLILSSIYTILIYVLARSLGLPRGASRLSAFLSIFGTGILRDVVYFVYDPKLAYTLILLFMILYFRKSEKLKDFTLREIIRYGLILGLLLIVHPDTLLSLGMFLLLVVIITALSRIKEKWGFIKIQLGIGLLGLIMSIILFYGPFLWNLLNETIPNTISGNAGFVYLNEMGNQQDYSIFKGILTRIGNTIPFLLLPFFIYGLHIIFQNFKKDRSDWKRVLLTAWIASYVIFLFLWAFRVLFNFLKYFPEWHIISPLIFLALGFAFYKLYSKFQHNPFIKYSLITIFIFCIITSIIWFYCTQIGMSSKVPSIMDYLYMFV